jgi:hypothetical protein
MSVKKKGIVPNVFETTKDNHSCSIEIELSREFPTDRMDAALIALATTMVIAVTVEWIEMNVREQETHLERLTPQMYTDPFDYIVDPFPAQKLAALRCFRYLYQNNSIWVHLAAPMQSGKTGVMVALTRLVMAHYRDLQIGPERMFVFTGMSDNDWRTQTRSRFPTHVRKNVYHRSGVKKICTELSRLRGEGTLRNVLLFIDESHIATKKDHTPRMIYQRLAELCPREEWAANNIRIVTVSATDPAKVITIQESDGFPCQVVRLETTEGYQSVETLVRDGRMRPINGNAHTTTAINLMRPVVEGYERPMYHIIRAAHGKAVETQAALAAAFPGTAFKMYDCNSKNGTGGETDSVELKDINDIVEEVPEQHTFVIIKNALYAAKTLTTTHVGVMYDRQTDNDSAVLQGLAGRACGYDKGTHTIVFTVENAIDRYLKTWRALCLKHGPLNLAVDGEGYSAPAQVMNLAVREDALQVGADELNPLVATDEALAAAAAPAQPREVMVQEHRVEFFPVGDDSIRTVMGRVSAWLRTAPGLHADVRKMKFDGRTAVAIERHRDDEGRYLSSLGGDFRVRTLAQMEASRQNLSFENRHPARLQPCYDDETLGLALRYLTGNVVAR